jgi:hypothetical protein
MVNVVLAILERAPSRRKLVLILAAVHAVALQEMTE